VAHGEPLRDPQRESRAVVKKPRSNPSTPHGLHSLTVLDDETIGWLLNTCPEI